MRWLVFTNMYSALIDMLCSSTGLMEWLTRRIDVRQRGVDGCQLVMRDVVRKTNNHIGGNERFIFKDSVKLVYQDVDESTLNPFCVGKRLWWFMDIAEKSFFM